MRKAKIIFIDQVHAKIEGLDTVTLNRCIDKLKFMVPYRFHIASFRLGRWDGSIRFFEKSGKTYINLLPEVVPLIVQQGYEITFDDRRPNFNIKIKEIDENIFADHVWPKGHFKEGEPITLRSDQVYAANMFARNHYALQVLATGFGKTILTAATCKVAEDYGRSVVIVPSKSLVEQTYDDFKLVGMDVGRYYGDVKEIGHTHTITTWQSLNELMTDRNKIDILAKMVDGVVQVLVDEAHQCKSTVLNDIMTKIFPHVPLRRGFTGTIPKEPHDAKRIIANIGEVVHRVTAKELQEKGILSRCHVMGLVTKDKKDFKSYDEETAYLKKDTKRLEFVSELANMVTERGNTLLLVNSVEAGKLLNDMIPGSKFVYGKTKVKERKSAYTNIQNSDNECIIATYQVAAVGINIPRIFNLIMVEAGKSFVRVIQTIGRGVRVAKDKKFVQIYDLSSNSKFSKKHYKTRQEYYDEAQYPYETFSGHYGEILNFVKESDEIDFSK